MTISEIEPNLFILAILVIYVPFHLLEEALGNFPETMYRHKWIPERISHGHWMANNIFLYLPLLGVGYLLFSLGPKFLCFGIGILIWGIINLIDHLVYTILDRKKSPGIFTGVLFGIVATLGLARYAEAIDSGAVFASTVVALFYVFLPILASMALHKRFKAIFL